MKRILCLSLIFLLLFCGCSSKTKAVEPKTTGFSCDAYITYDDMNVVGKIKIGGVGDFCAKITEPAILNGMEFIYSGDELKLKYFGIESDLSKYKLPDTGFIKIIRDCLQLAIGKPGIEKHGEDYILENEQNGKKISLYFRADGFPLKLSVPSLKLEAEFRNIEYSF